MTLLPCDDSLPPKWRGARYEPSVTLSGQCAHIRHDLHDAPELEALIADGAAVWVTEVRSPCTLVSRAERAAGSTQIVFLNDEEIRGTLGFVSGLMAVRDVAVPTAALRNAGRAGASKLRLPAGCWLIRGTPQESKSKLLSLGIENFIDFDRYQHWQKSLAYNASSKDDPNSPRVKQAVRSVAAAQVELLQVVDAGPEATCNYLLERFARIESQAGAEIARAVPTLPDVALPAPLDSLDPEVERAIATHLGECFTPTQAADTAVWTLCHAVWIGAGAFGNDGRATFCEGRNSKTKDGQPNSDGQTRNFLRRTGGLPHVRKSISVLVDCPIATAWWRWRIACQASAVAQAEGESLDPPTAHKALHPSRVWRGLVRPSLGFAVAMNEPRARAAAVVALHRHAAVLGSPATATEVEGLVTHLAALERTHNLAAVPWQQLLNAAQQGLNRDAAAHQ